MNNYQQEHKKRFLLSNILFYFFVIVFIMITIYVSLESIKYMYKIKTLEANTSKLRNELSSLKSTLDIKSDELISLNTDSGKIEYLRKAYPAVKEGEKMIVLYDSTNTKNFEVIVDTDVEGDIDFISRFKAFILKYTNI